MRQAFFDLVSGWPRGRYLTLSSAFSAANFYCVQVSEDRKCYRMVDQALVERKVSDVLPELVLMRTNLENTVAAMQKQLEQKGTELVEYKAKHDIRIQGEQGPS